MIKIQGGATGPIQFYPFGDAAVILQYEETEYVYSQMQAACSLLRNMQVPGVTEWVPGLTSITFYYLPYKISYNDVVHSIQKVLSQHYLLHNTEEELRTTHIPICYGEEYSLDLEEIANLHGLTCEEVIRVHSQATYTVNLMGFIPGFPYLKGLSSQIATPRLATPRQSVPAGSIGIAGKLVGIYPFEISGGWRIIGRTPLKLFDVGKEPPFLLGVGDRVKFYQISSAAFHEWRDADDTFGGHEL